MTLRPKYIKPTALILLLSAVVLAGLAACFIIQSLLDGDASGSANKSYESLALGQEACVFESGEACFSQYLKADFSPDDTYQLRFYCGDNSYNLIINSGAWAERTDDDGGKPILHLIPEYISSTGYEKITVTPILGDGYYFVWEFGHISDPDLTEYADCNLIDFEIKQLEIEISDEDYERIEAKRGEALNLGIIMTDDTDYVSAKVRADGEKYDADLRLKGDWADHMLGDQWSFRIDLQGDNCIYGMQKFSIQKPSTRTYIWEYLMYEMYREQGGAALRYDFADVFVNGVYKGVYAVEEFMQKRVIENSQKREGPVIRFSEDLIWQQLAYYENTDNLNNSEFFGAVIYDDVSAFSEKGTVGSELLSAYSSYAITQLNRLRFGEVSADEVLDIDLFAKYNAIMDLFSTYHGNVWNNQRFYYNPITALLEPVPSDCVAFYGTYTGIVTEESECLDFLHLYESEEFGLLLAKYLRQFAEGYPAFIKRHSAEINRYVTTIRQYEPDFEMYPYSVNGRINQVLKLLDTPLQPPAGTVMYDEEGSVQITVSNPNLLRLYITEIRNSDGSESYSKIFSVGNGGKSFVLPENYEFQDLSDISVAYRTAFSEDEYTLKLTEIAPGSERLGEDNER